MPQSDAEKVEALRGVIAEIDRLVRVRNRHLAQYESLLMDRMKAGEISLLNLNSRKSKAVFVSRERALLQLQCRILRRNLFYLRIRRHSLVIQLESLAPESVEQAASSGRGEDSAA